MEPKISIRWRKSTATFVIYKGRKVLESGFDTEQAACEYLKNPPKTEHERIVMRKFDFS